ncbi:hypothetical protein TNCV_2054611 [Trichonephila clavipes]|nr:hypothetical protein TNCV_2054611 [Trichonephila clavipes]
MECNSEFDPIPKINEPICSRRLARREDIANAMRQQVSRIAHGAVNTEAGGIQRLTHRWQRMVIAAGAYIEGLYAQLRSLERDIKIIATPGSSFTPTPLGHEENVGVGKPSRANALHNKGWK